MEEELLNRVVSEYPPDADVMVRESAWRPLIERGLVRCAVECDPVFVRDLTVTEKGVRACRRLRTAHFDRMAARRRERRDLLQEELLTALDQLPDGGAHADVEQERQLGEIQIWMLRTAARHGSIAEIAALIGGTRKAARVAGTLMRRGLITGGRLQLTPLGAACLAARDLRVAQKHLDAVIAARDDRAPGR